ncbi:MAG: thioesterase [Desulfobacterales bacterium]|nr:thioesterase [Desulfobacterales bacterium]
MNNYQNKIQKINVFFLPFAGGSYYAYRKFEHYLSDFLQIVTLDYPGRGKRLKDPLLRNLNDLADDVYEQIKDKLNVPYALYGHSMGAFLAFLVTQKISKKKLNPPLHLFVTGRQGPTIDSKEKDAYLLPKQEFTQRLMEYGGIPKEILAEKELFDFFEPIIRADFQAIGTFSYQHDNSASLNVPITAIIGLNDTTTYEEALKWQEVTTEKTIIKQLPGGHFFIFDHTPEICSIISRTLSMASVSNNTR